MAKVQDIQVCGGKVVHTLYHACKEYISCVDNGIDREKLNFRILLANGEVKHITIRDIYHFTEAYGDFAGLPNVIEWAEGKQ